MSVLPLRHDVHPPYGARTGHMHVTPRYVAQSALIASWFEGGRGLAFALAIAVATGRLGTVLCDVLSARFASPVHAYYLGTAVTAVSAAAAIAAAALDRRATMRRPHAEPAVPPAVAVGAQEKGGMGRLLVPPPKARSRSRGQSRGLDAVHVADVLLFPATFWWLVMANVCTLSAIFSFTNIAPDFFMRKCVPATRASTHAPPNQSNQPRTYARGTIAWQVSAAW